MVVVLVGYDAVYAFEFAGLAIQEFPNILGTFGGQIQLQSDNESIIYLFPGELGAINPDPQSMATNISVDVAVVHQVMSLQIDYELKSPVIPVSANNCKAWGNDGNYTLEICLVNYEADQNLIAAGMSSVFSSLISRSICMLGSILSFERNTERE
jgi:hypothetical protein